MYRLIIIWGLFCLTFTSPLSSQELSDEEIAAYILIDSTIVVTAERSGFDTEDFIRLVRKDSSFYRAFHNLRLVNYKAENDMRFFDKKNKVAATYFSRTSQQSDGDCRTMDVLEEKTTGNFYKRKKKYRYYTAKMYDRVFYTHGKICGEEEMLEEKESNLKGLQKYYNELKRLIFQPGERVKVPLIGSKTAIFDTKLAPYYDYFITSKPFTNGADCYVFSAVVKPDFLEKKAGKTVIKYLETFFEKSNLQVVGRKYHLVYSGVFDFDVTMDVELMKRGGRYYPRVVQYNGFWNIPTRKIEIANFTARISEVRAN